MFKSFDVKTLALTSFLSYILTTILNFTVHSVFPQIPLIKTGIVFVLILISITIAMIWTAASDGKFDRSDVIGMLVIIAIMFGVFYIFKHFLPELFSFIPENTKEVFSFVP